MNSFLSKKIVFFQFFCIIFLVFVHSYNLREQLAFPYSPVTEKLTLTTFMEAFFANCVLRFRIPLLFIISGYLLALKDTKPFVTTIKTKFKSLLVPYVLWSCFGLLVYCTVLFSMNTFDLQRFFPTFHEIRFQSVYQLAQTVILYPVSFQLWYMKVLIFLTLLYPVIKIAIRYLPFIFLVGTGVLWFISKKNNLLQGEGLFFFSLGIWLVKNQIDVQRKPAWLNLKAGFSLFVLMAITKTYLTFYPDLLSATIREYTLLFLYRMVEASGLLLAWFGLDKIVAYSMNNRYYRKWHSYSFFLYAIHAPLCIYLMDFCLSITDGFQYQRLLCFILCPTLTILFSLSIAPFIEKRLPGLYRVATGSRGKPNSVKQRERTANQSGVAVLQPA